MQIKSLAPRTAVIVAIVLFLVSCTQNNTNRNPDADNSPTATVQSEMPAETTLPGEWGSDGEED